MIQSPPFRPQPLVTAEEIALILASRRRAIAPDQWPPADCGDKWTLSAVSRLLGTEPRQLLAELGEPMPQDCA